MMTENNFSKDILIKTRDYVLDNCLEILNGKDNSISGKILHGKVEKFSYEQIEVLKLFMVKIVDMTLHELMYNFDESNSFKIISDVDKKITDIKFLHDEWLVGLFLEAIDLFSKYNNSYDIITDNYNIEK